MDTERTPLGSKSVPRYTFFGGGSPPKPKISRLQCCLFTTATVLLVTALIILLVYFLNWNKTGERSSNNSELLDGLFGLQWPLKDEKYTSLEADFNDSAKALEAGVLNLKKKDTIEDVLPSMEVDSQTFRHQLATFTTKRAQRMSRHGYVLDSASRELFKCAFNSTKNSRRAQRWKITKFPEWLPQEKLIENITIKCTVEPYRSTNGSCNNLAHPSWGSAFIAFRRILLPEYYDGISEPRKSILGSELPSAREISLAIHRPNYESDVNFTVMLAVWGQFIDHDSTATAISKGKNGQPIKCCETMQKHPDCFPVYIGKSDSFYSQFNISCMDFVRSAPAPKTAFGPREQINQATSYLDGSVVYGNDDSVLRELRTFQGGELKMLKTSSGDFLPVSQDLNDGCNRIEEFQRGRYCFISGDNRSNENLLITSMHLLFARQHNLIARQLAAINPQWEDEKIFQETRKILGAQIQHITYKEFLPAILPDKLIHYLNLSIKPFEVMDNYNSSVDASVANVFAAAAFRFGHSLLPGLMQYLHKNASRIEYLELHKMLFNPFGLFEEQYLESIMKAAFTTSSAKFDIHVTHELTQKLFQKEPKNACGLDLVALNIQRGRDHGLPSYPYWRTVCGLRKPETFEDLKLEIDKNTLSQLKNLYKSVNDIDLYTGALAENPIEGALLGPTITCLVADQFLRLKIGDRFWYERMEGPQAFTLEQLREIKKTSLAQIICETSDVETAQPLVMKKAGVSNEPKPCEEFIGPNFEMWRETNP